MNMTLARLLRIPLTVAVVCAALAVAVPAAMTQYAPYLIRPGIRCVRTNVPFPTDGDFPPGLCLGLADLYHVAFFELFAESTFRSLALLLGAAVLAVVVGSLLGVVAVLVHRRALVSGAVMSVTTLLAAIPAFFVAYFLQIMVILVGASPEGSKLVPVFGFGYDSHLVLPLLSISLPAVAHTAQLTAARMQDVSESDFITTANAKGLHRRWIIGIHVLPHARPILLEGLGSGLRVSVASLPIVELLFNWRGIGQLALEATGIHDTAGFIFSAAVLAILFTTLSAMADLSRSGALYRTA